MTTRADKCSNVNMLTDAAYQRIRNCQIAGFWVDVDTSCDGWQKVTSDVLSGRHADHTDLTGHHTDHTAVRTDLSGRHTVYTGHTGHHADLRR